MPREALSPNPFRHPRSGSLLALSSSILDRMQDLPPDEQLLVGLKFLLQNKAIKPGARVVVAALLEVVDKTPPPEEE